MSLIEWIIQMESKKRLWGSLIEYLEQIPNWRTATFVFSNTPQNCSMSLCTKFQLCSIVHYDAIGENFSIQLQTKSHKLSILECSYESVPLIELKNNPTHQISALYLHYDTVEDNFTILLLSKTPKQSILEGMLWSKTPNEIQKYSHTPNFTFVASL